MSPKFILQGGTQSGLTLEISRHKKRRKKDEAR